MSAAAPSLARAQTSVRTMQAAVLSAPRTIEIRSVDLPEPGPHEVRVRMQGCGICGSNLEPWRGRDWFRYPFDPGAPGHEGWGIVDAVGSQVTHLRPGRRVALLSNHAFADYDVAAAEDAIPLPRELDHMPFPGEPLGCAMNVFKRSGIEQGSTVAVVGIGFMGAILVALAKQAGARVLAFSRRPFALEVAKQYGADETLLMDDHWRLLDEVKRLTDGQGCEVAIEAVGAQWPLDLAAEITRTRGRLVVAGYHQDGPRQVNMQAWNWKGIDVINAHERDQRVYREGVQAAVEAVRSGRLDPRPLLTHRIHLAQLADGFRLMEERPDGFLKGIVIYE